ncbi:MAG: hypothetical protein JOZ96_12445 [Acidobacteria bacterium]|nr:hypothetical protein [Acidobacteriota bacterium]
MTQTAERNSTLEGGPGQGLAGKLFGLVELDSAGTVLYARFEGEGVSNCAGLNFYTEVATFRNVGKFKDHLESFNRGSQPAQSLHFTCDYEDGPVGVRVLLARMRGRADADVTKSILVHIRRAQ